MSATTCPGCTGVMKPLQAGAVELDRCTFCKGLWFDAGELEKVLGKKLSGALGGEIRARMCPHCKVNLHAVTLGEVQVDVCTTCRGVFLDSGELKALNGGQDVRVRTDAQLQDDVMAWLNRLGA